MKDSETSNFQTIGTVKTVKIFGKKVHFVIPDNATFKHKVKVYALVLKAYLTSN